MKTKLHNSSLGRIALMLKADMMSHKLPLSLYSAIILALLLLVPRLPLLFGANYDVWVSGWLDIYSSSFIIFNLLFATHIYSFVYIGERCLKEQPVTFSTLPMKLWEKFVGMNIFILGILLLSLCLFMLSYLVECLLIPEFASYVHLSLFPSIPPQDNPWIVINNVEIGGLYKYVVAGIFLILFPLNHYLLTWLNATYLRNAFVGLVALYAEIFIAFVLYGLMLMLLFGYLFNDMSTDTARNVEDALRAFVWGTAIPALTVTVVTIFLLRRRLRSLPY